MPGASLDTPLAPDRRRLLKTMLLADYRPHEYADVGKDDPVAPPGTVAPPPPTAATPR